MVFQVVEHDDELGFQVMALVFQARDVQLLPVDPVAVIGEGASRQQRPGQEA
jgi:hypothetical protein